MKNQIDTSIIALDKFIKATRDSGYKNTVSAVSELVDNSIQAEAQNIHIEITRHDNGTQYPLKLYVLDDGHGMSAEVLHQALRFGGSTRFNDRTGLGRYGMGLPNASLSQAKCVEVYSWQNPRYVIYSYLDVDEIADGRMEFVPRPSRSKLPDLVNGSAAGTGTIVLWSTCDRLDNRRHTTIVRKLKPTLGRVFRYYLWNGVRITVNGEVVDPIDPLYLKQPSVTQGGKLFAEPIEYPVRIPSPNGSGQKTANITVTFSELPVHEWHHLPNEEKRRLGVSNGAGVSVVRGGREIDYGWFFMKGKRRENYDDWWRAEVQFDPELDEMFGITHTKQQIRPSEQIYEIFGEDIANTARALNTRVRRSHQNIKTTRVNSAAEELASKKDTDLRDISNQRTSTEEKQVIERLDNRYPELNEPVEKDKREYKIIEDELGEHTFFTPVFNENRITLVLNPKHQFYKKIYKPLKEGKMVSHPELLKMIQLMMLSAARAESTTTKIPERRLVAEFRKEWSEILNAFLK